MKTRVLSCLFLSTLIAWPLQAREFTDLQGRKLDAELLAVSGNQATLKRASDGRAFTVTTTAFSEADQKFMAEFAAANVKYGFELRYTKKKLGEVKTKRNNTTYETETWAYKVDLRNLSSGSVADLRVDYWCFRREDGGNGRGTPRMESSGSTRIESIARSASATFDTSPVEINKQKLDGGFYYIDGSKTQQADGMGGMVVRVFKGDKEVFSFATKDDLLVAAVGKPQAAGSNAAVKPPR